MKKDIINKWTNDLDKINKELEYEYKSYMRLVKRYVELTKPNKDITDEISFKKHYIIKLEAKKELLETILSDLRGDCIGDNQPG